jgi:uncharacterized protein (TIGR02145 family)
MVENLKTTKYNDGNSIPNVTDATAWLALTTPGFCWYNNDPTTVTTTNGAYYNWYTVNTGKLCPSGWHVPSDAEWTILTSFLGGDLVAGKKLKESGNAHWKHDSSSIGDNSSGFTALPTALRSFNAKFYDMGEYGPFWSTNNYDSSTAWYVDLVYYGDYLTHYALNKEFGMSIRCVHD